MQIGASQKKESLEFGLRLGAERLLLCSMLFHRDDEGVIMYIPTRKTCFLLSVALSTLALVTTQAVAAVCTAGQIDTTFGTSSDNGFVLTSPLLPSAFVDGALEGVAVDSSSGALYVVETASADAAGNGTAGITKVLQGGKRDTSFGGIGFAVAAGQVTGGSSNVLADLSGNVLLTTNSPTSGISLFRFSSAGVPDASFGNYGLASVALTSVWAITAIKQQPSDGKYLVVASAANPAIAGQVQPVVIRFNTGGSLDNSFGTGGIAFLFPSSVTDPNAFGRGTDLIVSPDGSILVTGRIMTTGTGTGYYFHPFVARLLPTGVLDGSFGTSNGFTLYDFGQFSVARKMAVQSDGKIVLVGITTDANNIPSALAIRTSANGIPDLSFANKGWATITQGFGVSAFSLALQNNNKIVVGATEWLDVNQNTGEPLVIRLTSTGQLDPAFGSGGLVAIPSPNGGTAIGGDTVRIDPTSKIVFHFANANPAPRIDQADYLVRLDTGSGPNCH
jgi:uncharacterized delta-60 repeat protein